MTQRRRVRARWHSLLWSAALTGALAAASVHAEPYEVNPDAAARDPDYAAGKAALERKDWVEAARRFAKAAAGDPGNPDLQNYLGYAYRNLEQFDAALRHYQQALRLDPRHRGAHEYMGETYLLIGDLPHAQQHLAALRAICLLSCEELEDLARAVDAYQPR